MVHEGATAESADGRGSIELVRKRLHEYDDVLVEWNDQLNARLAVVGAYFGEDVRDFLDRMVHEAFRAAGQHLEHLVIAAEQQTRPDDDALAKVAAEIADLNDVGYRLGVTMMVRVRESRVGRAAPGALGEIALAGPEDVYGSSLSARSVRR